MGQSPTTACRHSSSIAAKCGGGRGEACEVPGDEDVKRVDSQSRCLASDQRGSSKDSPSAKSKSPENVAVVSSSGETTTTADSSVGAWAEPCSDATADPTLGAPVPGADAAEVPSTESGGEDSEALPGSSSDSAEQSSVQAPTASPAAREENRRQEEVVDEKAQEKQQEGNAADTAQEQAKASAPSAAAKPKAKPAPKKRPTGAAGAASSASAAKSKAKATAAAAAARAAEGSSSSEDEGPKAGCPSSKKDKDFERELKKVKKRMQGTPNKAIEPVNPWLNNEMSQSERELKKFMFLSFYREQYAKLKAQAQPDMEQYTPAEVDSLKIKNGHRPMPRPAGVRVPKGFREPVGVISAAKLAKCNADAPRKFVCLHGDIFEVTDRPDKYGTDGPYAYMTGRDLTWGFVRGDDAEEEMDKYYDVFKIQPVEKADRKLQGLMSWWAFYEKEYGEPIGRLDVYEKEWELPPPPMGDLEDGCSVM